MPLNKKNLNLAQNTMKLSEDDNSSQYIINHYTKTGVVVNKIHYTNSFILSSNYFNDDWGIDNINDLSTEYLQPLLAQQPDVLLIGFGYHAQHTPSNAIACLTQTHIGFEMMSIPAACRTFNLLTAEDRIVVAGFILNNK